MSVAKQSTARFVYPFSFSSNTFEDRASSVNRAHWEELKSIWRQERFQSDDLLPVVERYLNGAANSDTAKARLWKLEGNALQSPKGLGGGCKNSPCQWTVIQRKLEIAFRLVSVELVMFQIGIGFVVIEASPESNELNDWLDFVHAFRFFEGRGTQVKCRRKTNDGGELEFFPESCGGLHEHPGGSGTMLDLVKGILAGGEIDSDIVQWWQSEFIFGQAIPYCSLFLNSSPADQDATTIYRLRNLFHSTQEVRLGDKDLDLAHEKLLPYANRQWFVISLDSVHFVAFDPPDTPFFNATLPGHLGKLYLLLFLMALHQRFKLINFSEDVSRNWSDSSRSSRLQSFELLNQEILGFRAHGLFGQIGQRDHLHCFYRKLHDVFEIDRQFTEVSDEVRDMHGYMQVAQSRKLEQRLNFLAVVLGVPGLVLAFLGVNMLNITSNEGMTWWAAGAVTVVVSGMFGFFGLKWLQKH